MARLGGRMATFRNRGTKQNPLIQVQIRRKNYPYQTKSFTSQAAARAWASDIDLVFKALAVLV